MTEAEKLAAIAELQERLAIVQRAVTRSGEGIVAAGERAIVTERNPRERRALVKAVRKVRRAIGWPQRTAAAHPVPTGTARTVRADASTLQPIERGAP
jgi:hypothetical protein